MKKLMALLIVLAMVFSLTACGKKDDTNQETTAEDNTNDNIIADGNILPGGDFSESNTHWNIYKESGGSGDFEISDGELKVKIKNPGKKSHSVQIYCDGFELLQNSKYKLTMVVSSDVERTIEWRAQINGGDYHAYAGEQEILIGPDKKTIVSEFVMQEGSDPAPRFCLNMGFDKLHPDLAEHNIYIEEAILEIVDSSSAVEVDTDTGEVEINVNQLGYKPDDVKKASFRTAGKDDTFEIIDANSKQVVYTGKVEGERYSPGARETLAYADFTDFKTPGTYRIRANNSGESYIFNISEDVNAAAFKDIVRMLYLQRCGTELTEELAGDFAHKACHTQIATDYVTGEKVNVSGGWHDAGDYGRYVVSGAKTVIDLLNAYEMYPEVFTDDYDIPESGNKVPDILDEARYELEWMFKMQDSKSGGVHHKVTGKEFEGQVVADKDDTELYLMELCKWDSADFAAVMARASVVYKQYDKSFASKCLSAAKKAYKYFYEHKNETSYKNPEDVSTGEYPDGRSADEELWMCAELYKATGDQTYHKVIKEYVFDEDIDSGLGWATMDLYGIYTYLTSPDTDEKAYANMKSRFKEVIDEIVTNVEGDGYNVSIGADFCWGSNMNVANNGILLLWADKILGDKDYTAYAKQQMDYLFGNNALSYSFVTGYGEHASKNPHHRPSLALEKTMKGMLIGGPNKNLEDPYAKTVLAGVVPAKCYRDSSQSFSLNEITIYWNSPLICLMAAFV